MHENKKCPQVGDSVIFHDSHNRPHNALVTAVHGAGSASVAINLVHVSHDNARQDGYGRQIERPSSVCHKSLNPAAGMYWRWPEEEPNAYQQPSV